MTHSCAAAPSSWSDGPVALVTGGSRGIGRAIARTLARDGFSILLTYVSRPEEAERTVEEIAAAGGRARAFALDVGDDAAVEAFFATEIKDKVDLAVLVNNAGISYVGLMTDMSYSEWNEVIATNLNSCFLTCREAVPGMVRRKKGKIINISSVWGTVGASMEVAYSASKGGMNAFTRALAKELGPSNIQVNAIACGIIDTAMNRFLSGEELEALIEEIPADRVGKPQEVAALVKSLCEGNDYLTGQVITLDGGWT